MVPIPGGVLHKSERAGVDPHSTPVRGSRARLPRGRTAGPGFREIFLMRDREIVTTGAHYAIAVPGD